jgi:hypothetical protein
MKTMNRDEFLSMLAEPLRESTVEAAGRKFRLREMSEEDATKYELSIQSKEGKYDFSKARRSMIALMLIDDEGNRMVDDESQLKVMPRSLAGLLFDECQKLNRYEPGEVKDLVKNSDEADG